MIVDASVICFHALQGAEVVQLILDNGKLRPPDAISQLSRYDTVKGTAQTNVPLRV